MKRHSAWLRRWACHCALGKTHQRRNGCLQAAIGRSPPTEWHRLRQANVDERPVALLGPFGGAEPLKGFTDLDHESLAAQITGLIVEGFFVVLAPNGTEWGSAAVAKNVIGRLSREERSFVAIGPDSAEKCPTTEWTSPNSPLSYRDTSHIAEGLKRDVVQLVPSPARPAGRT